MKTDVHKYTKFKKSGEPGSVMAGYILIAAYVSILAGPLLIFWGIMI